MPAFLSAPLPVPSSPPPAPSHLPTDPTGPSGPTGPTGPTSVPRAGREPKQRFALPHPTVTIQHWDDPVLEQFGHDPRSNYVEQFWLPILGPSSTFFMRFLARRFDDEPEQFELDLREASRCVGVGVAHAPGAPFFRTVERTISFGFGRLVDDRVVLARSRMPSLTRRQVLRLPRRLQQEHDQWVEDQREREQQQPLQRRARALALSLFELGEDYESAERQLHRWKFHPAIAHDAVRWAASEHVARANGIDRVAGSQELVAPRVDDADSA